MLYELGEEHLVTGWRARVVRWLGGATVQTVVVQKRLIDTSPPQTYETKRLHPVACAQELSRLQHKLQCISKLVNSR